MTAQTPEQDSARPSAGTDPSPGAEPADPQDSRGIRRRLAFSAAETLEDPPQSARPSRGKGGRAKDTPSPWQRAQAAWERAGMPWHPDDASKAAPEPTKPGKPAETAKPKAAAAPKAAPKPEPKAASKPEPKAEPEAKAPSRGVGGRGKLVGAGAVAVVVVAAGVYVVGNGGDEAGPAAKPAALVAERMFAAYPAGPDGQVQKLSAVAASGGTVVAVGDERAGVGGTGRERAQFLVSADAGRNWRLAQVKATGGGEPSPGDQPRHVAGGSGRWAALGQAAPPPGADETAAGTAVWTSRDGRVWTREATPGGVFRPNDRINALARTPAGFVAVGANSPSGRFQGDQRAVVWTSADGRAWQRLDRPGGGEITGLDRVAATANGALVAHGWFTRKVAKTVKGKGKGKQQTTVQRGEGLWRSPDGGRTWTPVAVPQAQGSYGPTIGLVAGPGGVYVAREGRRVTGPKKRRTTTRYGVVFASGDGQTWAPTGQVSMPSYGGVARLAGSSTGLAVLVRGKGGAGTVLRSGDGRAWQPGGDVGAMVSGPGAGLAVNGLTVAAGTAAVIAGRRGDDPYLALSGTVAARPVNAVDLRAVPGAIRPERAVTSMSVGAGRVVAVGSTGGGGAVWSAPAATPDAWGRGQTPDLGAGRAAGGPGQPRQRFGDVVHGSKGWLAVGRVTATDGKVTPLVAGSADGVTWRKAPFPGAKGNVVDGCTSGPSGYVVVGTSGGKAAAWRSTDLKGWKRGGNAGRGDLDGRTWMRDVTVTSKGYVAVGGRQATGGAGRKPVGKPVLSLPAVWTSQDGLKWSAVAPPPLPSGIVSGAFHQVVARGDVLVALGSGSTAQAPGAAVRSLVFTGVSSDGGRTWRTSVPAGVDQGAEIASSVVTPKGFVLAGAVGRLGARDAGMWASPDGAAWRRVPARGTGLDGPGDQRLTALAAVGGAVVAVGVNADHRGESPTLWRTTSP